MSAFLRRVRGVLGIGTLWGAAGGALGVVAGLGFGLFGGFDLGEAVLLLGVGVGGVGYGLGCAFGLTLTTFERRRTLDELTPARAARWGAVAGALVALIAGLTLVPTLFAGLPLGQASALIVAGVAAYGALTAGLAAGTVAVARGAPRDTLGKGGASGETRLTPSDDNDSGQRR